MPKSKIDPEKYKDLVSTNKSLIADYKPLNFDSLLKRKAVRITHQGLDGEEYNPDPKAGFSIVSAYNDAIGKGEGTNKWKDNPEMYSVVRNMFQNEPENMGAHKYLQIIQSAKDMGLSDEEIYMPSKSTEYSKGGAVKRAKRQMKKLFEDGGLLQEGGTVDKESGNEVPTGSLKKEVRDDIPAQLSEGEFVFPADVVRFIGLQKLMELRQAAKEGLAKMESMGQMGNADEATEEDTGEFETEVDDILDEIESESEGEDEEVKKPKGEQLKLAAGGAVSPQPNPFAVPFSVERYSKEGEKDIFMPTFGGQTQAAIPEGFQKSTKVQSFGGVFRKPEEAQKTVTESLGLPTSNTSMKIETPETTDLTKTEQPIPDAYKGLDTDTDTDQYLMNLAKKDEEKYAAEDKAKGRAWTRGTVLDNPFKDVKDLGTVSVQVGVDTDGQPIFEEKNASLTDWLLKQTDPASARIAELVSHKTTDIQKIEQDGDVYYRISGKTGGADRERMSQTYKEIGDKLVPVGKASFYKGAHPDAAKVKGIAQVAGIFAAPFTAGLSTSIGSAIMGAGAVGAQTVGSAVLGAAFNGLTAAATGGNIGKAMIGGAAAGALNANAGEITTAIIGTDNLNSIASTLNLKPAQVSNIFVGSIGSGVTTAIRGGDFGDVLTSFKDSLISSGVSEIAAANVMKSLSGTMDPDNLRRIGTATKMLSNVAINASMKGLDINKAIQYYAPTVMTRALTTPGGG